MGLSLSNLETVTTEIRFEAHSVDIGGHIGRYKLLQRIGEGGSGVVYLAEQETPVHRQVALKLIKHGMDTKEVMARFDAERQALALMDHPNIARVYDAGSSAGGGPFFVMELVRGARITDFCDQNHFSSTQRLELFIQVCRAVQHAHQKGVIHRDLKPSNILIANQDGLPTPKVIDFGIAKATARNPGASSGFTAQHQFIGTPAYMSPEQSEVGGLDIDTRSDIYSLGVLLYELLTGTTPFEQKAMAACGLDEMIRMIRHQEPLRPSTRLKTATAKDLARLAQCRQVDPQKLISQIQGDLDWIVMKCLEKDRSRRYESVNNLSLDLHHYLHNEPVMARSPTHFYRLRKLVRRHKLAFAFGIALATALGGGFGISTRLFLQERKARQEQVQLRTEAEAQRVRAQANETKAESEAEKSRQVARLLEDMLESAGPSAALGRDTTLLREILDRAATSISGELTNRPEVEMELRETLAKTYHDLSFYTQMEAMARRNLELAASSHAEETDIYARSLHLLGDALMHQGNLAEAEKLHRQGLDLNLRLFTQEGLEVAASRSQLATVLEREGFFVEAEKLHRQALTTRQRLLGNDPLVADSLSNLGLVLDRQGKLAEAEILQSQVLVMQRKLRGPEHPDVATALHNLAGVLHHKGSLKEAESTYEMALEMRHKILGKENPAIATTLHNFARVLRDEGRLAESERLFEQAFSMRRKLLRANHPAVNESFESLLEVLRAEGDTAKAQLISDDFRLPARETK